MHPFAHKHIWLIGASEGIGEALARQLAGIGARLSLSARSVEKLRAAVARLSGQGHISLPLDVTSADSVTEAWQTLQKDLPDIVIYNAGAYEPMSALRLNLEQAERMVNVNFSGALRIVAQVLPALLARGSGHIVLVGSVAGYSGLPNAIGYGASKAGLIHLAENMKLDLKDTPLKIQLVSPGFVKTRLTEKNTFAMPFLLTREEAADRIVRGMERSGFEIHFPKRFTFSLKFLRLLPYGLYFRIIGRLPSPEA